MIYCNVNKENGEMLKKFLTNVPSINDIDEEIVENAVIALEENKIIGCISYEEFNKLGLIRYFIFKNSPSKLVFKELLSNLEQKVSAFGIEKLIGIACDEPTKELFVSLGFNNDNKNIYIDETSQENTNFQNALFMFKELN